MSLDREFEKVFNGFINDELIDVWEKGYMFYWLRYKNDIGFKYDYNTLFNNKVIEFVDNNNWELKDEMVDGLGE